MRRGAQLRLQLAHHAAGHLVSASFIQNPHAPPDTSCLAAMSPVPFDDRGAARIYFGAAFTSVWDNPAAP